MGETAKKTDEHEWFYHWQDSYEGRWFHDPSDAIEEWAGQCSDITRLRLYRGRRPEPGDPEFDRALESTVDTLIEAIREDHYELFAYEENAGYSYEPGADTKAAIRRAVLEDWRDSDMSLTVVEPVDPYSHADVNEILAEMWGYQ